MSRFSMLLAVSAFSSLYASTVATAQPLVLSKDGQPNAVIVLSARPSVAAREGAKILSDHLAQICGGVFRVVSDADLSDATVKDGRVFTKSFAESFILVGESSLTQSLGVSSKELGPGGTLVRVYPNSLVLLGPDARTPSDPNGTRYAVTLFLEESLGCRFLWPGELGKVVPKRRTIEIGAIDRTLSPRIRQRRIRMASGYGTRKDKGVKRLGYAEADFHRFRGRASATTSDGSWADWHRLGGTLRLASGHSFGDMWEKHKDDHPEWFALQPDGTRDQSRSPDRSRLCVSNVELINEIAKDRIERLNRSETGSVSIGPNDGGQTAFCRCPECEKLDPPESRKLQNGGSALTDRYVYFWNEIAKRVAKVHPDATLTADAYSVYSAPPVRRTLHPNIAIRFVGIKYNNDDKRRQDRDDWDAWSRAVKRIYFRPNLLLSGRRQGTPFLYAHKMAEDFKYMAQRGLIGTDFDSCCHHWATQGLNYYVCAKLHWDPDLDVDVLINDYCRSGFGSGAETVKQYLRHVESITDKIAADKLDYTEPYTPEAIGRLQSYLDAAAAATRDEPDAHQRVAFLRSGLDYTRAYVAVFRVIREHRAAGGGRLSEETKQRIRDHLDNNWLVSRDVFANHHFAVNVATVAWGSWSYFARFGWSDPSPEVRRQVE